MVNNNSYSAHYFHLICLIPREAFCMNGTDRSLNLVGPNALFWQRLFQYRDTPLKLSGGSNVCGFDPLTRSFPRQAQHVHFAMNRAATSAKIECFHSRPRRLHIPQPLAPFHLFGVSPNMMSSFIARASSVSAIEVPAVLRACTKMYLWPRLIIMRVLFSHNSHSLSSFYR